MQRFWAALALVCVMPAAAQDKPDPAGLWERPTVATEHPRIFLRPSRLRLLRRERDRNSVRWQELQAATAGAHSPAEPGLSLGLLYQVAADSDSGRRAIEWALGPDADLRQMSIVFDWCQDLLTQEQRTKIAARIAENTRALAANNTVPAIRSRALAAIALDDGESSAPSGELDLIIREWWNGFIAPALEKGKDPFSRSDAYPLFELLHAVRDNANVDLSETSPAYFRDLPLERLMGYYPAAYRSAGGAFRIGFDLSPENPDLRVAALSRAADLAIVAFDNSAREAQALQGWLMHDQFSLRGSFGAPYEFLWANPYQPGLSYYHLPTFYFSAVFGKLFLRSGWDDSAEWAGYAGRAIRKFSAGRVTEVRPGAPPVRLDSAVLCAGAGDHHISAEKGTRLFVVSLAPGHVYRAMIEGEKTTQSQAGPGGILQLRLPAGKSVTVRITEIAPR